MPFAAQARQFDLPLPLAEGGALLRRLAIVTVRATHALFIPVRRLVGSGDGTPTTVTLVVTSLLQTLVHRDAVVENETLALHDGSNVRPQRPRFPLMAPRLETVFLL